MMSTTGRSPVMAAPTPRPVIPGSEIGESRTRSGPNSSTRPASTLNGVPASATSSPMMNTVSSRRISSASASLTACPNVSVRTPAAVSTALGEDIFGHLTRVGIRRVERELHAGLDLRARAILDAPQCVVVSEALGQQPRPEHAQRIALVAPPELFLILRPVVGAVDIADVVPVVAVGVAEQECGASA